ncbi:MAG: metal-dependent hydrolase [Acidimicrobiales bacterium]|nr:metal-dependent hydrolase [Acidimicrobiales bacterium]
MPQTLRSEQKVPTRRISFEESLKDVPMHFAADGDLVLSHFAASLSAVFPDGEDFFVRSVRHFRHQVSDPDLKRQVTGFIGQEAMHGREHRAFNRRLAQLGYPTRSFERITKRGLKLGEWAVPAIASLAVTAALEHFTATLAELVLSDETTRGLFGDGEVQNLFLWHALEESEHKAVAFDVYRTVGGSEGLRVVTMNVVTAAFIGGISLAVVLSLLGDRRTYRPRTLLPSLRSFWRSPIVSRELWHRLREYNRPGFHPADRDATELVDRWRDELFGPAGTLNDKLAGAA